MGGYRQVMGLYLVRGFCFSTICRGICRAAEADADDGSDSQRSRRVWKRQDAEGPAGSAQIDGSVACSVHLTVCFL